MGYIPNIKSKEEFLSRFNNLFFYFDEKEDKTQAESMLFDTRIIRVRDYIEKGIPLPSPKEVYKNTLVFFEMAGGWELMQSDIGKEATDLLYYFVQNY
jgi:hypothetical protein